MLCEKCQQSPATIHLKQNINGQIQDLYLCSNCAAKYGMPYSFDSFFKDVMDSFLSTTDKQPTKDSPPDDRHCSVCGLTYEEFKQTSRLGCANCYKAFRSELDLVLKKAQGNNRHQGKIPNRCGEELLIKQEIANLRSSLKEAVAAEEYEEAARLRDKIKHLEEAGRQVSS